NGNTMIGYGLPNYQGFPNGAEVEPSGNIVWEFRFKDSTEYSYRVYKGDNNVGIADVDASNYLYVFPNPSTGVISFDVNVPAGGKAQIAIVNLVGQTVYE